MAGHSPEERSTKFSWRDTAVGAISSLIVTVIGGAIVWYFTLQPQAVERVTYRVDSSASFIAEGRILSFVNITIVNEGRAKASSINVRAFTGRDSLVQDSSVSFMPGPPPAYRKEVRGGSIRLFAPALLPSERIRLSLLISGQSSANFPISVRSDNALGVRIRTSQDSDEKKIFSFWEMLLVLASLLVGQNVIALLIRFRRRQKGKNLSQKAEYFPSVNNAGFVLLHQGMISEAKKLFEEEIFKGRGEQITISNLASCLALEGDFDGARAHINAVDWLERSSHETAMLSLNKSIVAYEQGDIEAGWRELSAATRIAGPTILYVKNSLLFKAISEKDNRVMDILK